MNIFSLSMLEKQRRLNRVIRLKVDEQTARYRSDNVQLLQHYLAEQHRLNELGESLRYAQRMQQALMPDVESLLKKIGDGFVFHASRDVLGGDFVWGAETSQGMLIAVADCTGHGLPGALLSVLCTQLLNRVVHEERITDPSQILCRLDALMVAVFSTKEQQVRASYDGMDIALCLIDAEQQMIHFAGAMRPMLLVTEGTVLELNSSRYPIGGMRYENNRTYSATQIKYQKGDFMYLFSDGFCDQFGGKDEKKFGRKRLRALIGELSKDSMRIQQEQIAECFLLWKGDFEQTDDVLMLGIRL